MNSHRDSRHYLSVRLALSLAPFAILAFACWSARPAFADDSVNFNRDIRPLLSDRCFQCHGPDAKHREADLRLDTEAGSRADLGGHAAIVPGMLEASEIWNRITSDDASLRMPPGDDAEPLSSAEQTLIRRWIETGAKYDRHWSLAPLTRPAAPSPRVDSSVGADWARGPIDQFIQRGYANASDDESLLGPNEEADATTLIRRLTFDLTGMPPTPQEVEALLADQRPGAYERVVDRLLASPRFGERLAIYWLDLVRYADTVGYHGDQDHNAAMYREYVIRAFNKGTPFDQFTIEQLAGDLLASPSDMQLAASGYNRLLQTTHEGGAQDKEYLAKYAADRVRNVSTVWMGATLGCAECHDHKYDPYTQRDFYSMAAFFADLTEEGAYSAPNSLPTSRKPEKKLLPEPTALALQDIDKQLAALRTAGKAASDPQREAEIQSLEERREQLQSRSVMQMISQPREPREMRILERGDWMDTSGEVVAPAGPAALPEVPGEGRRTRLDLARWLASREQPQTARVLVNRLWRLFMGEGISRGVEDTGSQGEWPSHPDLLNYLAVELIDGGWQLKPLIRQIVTSQTYRQSSIPTPQALKADPTNRWWSRQNRFRLEAEMIRDQALAVSGLLVERVGGVSAKPYQPKGYYAHLNFPTRTYKPDNGAGQYRRGVYIHWQRQFLHPMLQAFDAPSREECTAARPRSNTPQAALVLLNDPTFVEAARRLAARTLREAPAANGKTNASDISRLQHLWQLVVSRSPDEVELQLCQELLNHRRARYAEDPEAAETLLATGLSPRSSEDPPAELAAWTCVARALFSLSEANTRN